MSLPSSSAVAYADDVTLISYGTTAAEATNNMQDLLSSTDVWASNNLTAMTMSISPFIRKKVLHYHQVMLANSQLTTVKSIRILKVQFYDDLSWLLQFDAVRRKINCMIGVLKRCGRSINTHVTQKVYNLFNASHLDYCLLFGGTSRRYRRTVWNIAFFVCYAAFHTTHLLVF